jgi:geranylgeranyl pyrophosphate synthase
VRRRKQSLPILLLRERLTDTERDELAQIYAAPNVERAGVTRVLALLERERVREHVEAEIARYHDDATSALLSAARPGENPSRDRLLALVEQLSSRSG